MAKKKFVKEFEKPKKMFLCPECGEQHPTKQGAINCCPPDDIEHVFLCGTCGAEHGDNKKEAQDCCMTITCPDCGEEFFCQEDAEEHVCLEEGD